MCVLATVTLQDVTYAQTRVKTKVSEEMPASFKARAGKFLADCKVTIQTFIKNTVGGQVLRTQRKIVHGEFFGRVEGSGELYRPV